MLGIADQPDLPQADILGAVGIVEDAFAAGIVVERVDGEVAALGILFLVAIDVVAQDTAAFMARTLGIVLGIARRMIGPEGGDLDDFAPEVHMDQLEAPTDHAGIAELGADLFGGGAGGHVEILGG
ncbi:hypothetical protein Q3H58_002676 [Pseudomonas psychrotolerans]|nr:hypothetical protein [Pseudomonas psychrotolerans]